MLGLLDLRLESEQVKLLAEVTLTLVLFADASRISLRALRREFAVPLRLLGIGLPLTIVAGTLVGRRGPARRQLGGGARARRSCSPAPTPRSARRSSPTSAIPSRIRQGLNVESGLNDGLCVPLFFIAIAIAEADAGTASDARRPSQLVLEQIGYGLVGGVVAGVVGGARAAASPRAARLIEPHWLQILTVASALLAAGVATGARRQHLHRRVHRRLPVRRAAPRHRRRGHLPRRRGRRAVQRGRPSSSSARSILGPLLDELTWQIVLYAVLSLTVVRMLPVALAMLGTGARRQTVAFLGWFGPRGLASIVFAVILLDDAELPHLRTLLLAITVTIALSVYAHGLTARPLTERYVRWWDSHPRDAQPAMESVPAGRAPRRCWGLARSMARPDTLRQDCAALQAEWMGAIRGRASVGMQGHQGRADEDAPCARVIQRDVQSVAVSAFARRAAVSHFEACVPARSAAAAVAVEGVRREACGGDQPGGQRVRVPHLARLRARRVPTPASGTLATRSSNRRATWDRCSAGGARRPPRRDRGSSRRASSGPRSETGATG